MKILKKNAFGFKEHWLNGSGFFFVCKSCIFAFLVQAKLWRWRFFFNFSGPKGVGGHLLTFPLPSSPVSHTSAPFLFLIDPLSNRRAIANDSTMLLSDFSVITPYGPNVSSCGYCKSTKGSHTYGMSAHLMTCKVAFFRHSFSPH